MKVRTLTVRTWRTSNAMLALVACLVLAAGFAGRSEAGSNNRPEAAPSLAKTPCLSGAESLQRLAVDILSAGGTRTALGNSIVSDAAQHNLTAAAPTLGISVTGTGSSADSTMGGGMTVGEVGTADTNRNPQPGGMASANQSHRTLASASRIAGEATWFPMPCSPVAC